MATSQNWCKFGAAFFDKNRRDIIGASGGIGLYFINYLGPENYFAIEISLGGIRWRVKLRKMQKNSGSSIEVAKTSIKYNKSTIYIDIPFIYRDS